jgi:chemotaxis protein MotB
MAEETSLARMVNCQPGRLKCSLKSGVPTLARIAQALNKQGFELRVEGHTDNIPIHTARFKNNWELSSARAAAVLSMLVDNYGFDPRTISLAGYGEFRPAASNDTEEGRRSNRRIDLVVVGPKHPDIPAPASDAQGK